MTTPSAHQDKIQALRDARGRYEDAARAYRAAFRAAFPIGARFTSVKHGRVQCEVVGHDYGIDELRARSETGKTYRIGVYHIIGALTDESSSDSASNA